MSMFDDDPSIPPERDSPAPPPDEAPSGEPNATPFTGDPITYAPVYPAAGRGAAAYSSNPALPEDLRISWSWPHFIIFIFFTLASFVVVQTALALYYAPPQHLSPKQYEQYLLNKPQFLFGTNLIWYALIFLFLYVTLGVLRESPFWSSLGWKKLKPNLPGSNVGPWVYFFSGCALAIFVAVASSQVHGKENMPIQELLKNRSSALLLMGMAVLVAPLVEETVFRGYLYPLFARIVSTAAQFFGMESAIAIRTGVLTSIFVTGTLFGLMHGSQLAWTWGIVALLSLVGVIFTFARAHAGTVLASFLLHLGYNSMISVTTVIGTHGFTQIPTLH